MVTAPSPSISSSKPAVRSTKGRILLLLRAAGEAEMLRRALEPEHEVSVALDLREAVMAFDAQPWDLLLVDETTASGDGQFFIEHLRAHARSQPLPVILVQDHDNSEMRGCEPEAIFDEFLVRPFSRRELTARIQTQLQLVRIKREAAEQRRENKDRFRDAADRSHERSQMAMALRAGRIGTFAWDIPADRVSWSPELESIYGLRPGTFEGTYRAWANRVVPEDVLRIDASIRRWFDQKIEEAEYEFRVILPDGSLRWLEGKARFIFGPDGKPRRMIGINIDIDDRKRGELNAVFIGRQSDEVALLSDPHAIVRLVSRDLGLHLSAQRCYFVTTDDASSQAAVDYDWIRDSSAPSVAGLYPLSTFAHSEIWRNVTVRTVAVDDVTKMPFARASAGSAALRIVSWASTPFMRDGRWVASLVVACDRPRRWRADEIQLIETVLARTWPLVERARSEQAVAAAEAKIRESEERLRITVQAGRLGTWDINPQTGEMVWDARGKELFGMPAEADVTWEKFYRAVHSDDRHAVQAAVDRALGFTSGGDYDIEFRTSAENEGTVRWVRACGKACFDARQHPSRFIGTALDITDLVKARETLAQRRTELERIVAERTSKLQETVAELEGFSYSISHDLRAPLRAMQTFAHILEDECHDIISPNCQDYLRRIVNASQRMDRLIHDVLVYSQVSRHELRLAPVNLESLIDSIVETYPQSQPITIMVTRPLPMVLGNEASLTQCLSNLLANAVKFVAPGIRPHVEIWATEEKRRVRLYVRDNGIGIAPEAHERIFGIFERLNLEYEGTGIGLALVRKAAERMGGNVTVTSHPGEGSTFCVELAGV